MPRAARFQFPQRAIERVARAAGGSRARSSARVSPASIVSRMRFERGEHAFGVIIEVVDAGGFAAPFDAPSRSVTTVAGIASNV